MPHTVHETDGTLRIEIEGKPGDRYVVVFRQARHKDGRSKGKRLKVVARGPRKVKISIDDLGKTVSNPSC